MKTQRKLTHAAATLEVVRSDGRVVKRQERLGTKAAASLRMDSPKTMLLDAQLVERGEDSDGVSCRDERPEGEQGK